MKVGSAVRERTASCLEALIPVVGGIALVVTVKVRPARIAAVQMATRLHHTGIERTTVVRPDA